jgi:CRISPR-associated protein Cas2
MLEIAPGVYTSPRMTAAVRERVWEVCLRWYQALEEGSLVMTWRDSKESGGQGVRMLGEPPKELCDYEGVLMVRCNLPHPKDETGKKAL